MNIFEAAKAAVPLRKAAECYGLQISPNGMACCPFHEDRHPSLKLNEDYFFCFGCGAHGDVIDFTAGLFWLSLLDAAEKLTNDFGIGTTQGLCVRSTPTNTTSGLERLCIRVLSDYLRLLQIWRLRYTPVTLATPPCDNGISCANKGWNLTFAGLCLNSKALSEIICRILYFISYNLYFCNFSIEFQS